MRRDECAVDGDDGKRTDKPVSIDHRLRGRPISNKEASRVTGINARRDRLTSETKILTIRRLFPIIVLEAHIS
jgi:hypothetical protein